MHVYTTDSRDGARQHGQRAAPLRPHAHMFAELTEEICSVGPSHALAVACRIHLGGMGSSRSTTTLLQSSGTTSADNDVTGEQLSMSSALVELFRQRCVDTL